MDISSSIYGIAGIGYTFAKRLEKLEIFTVEDLINHYPFRYDDYSKNSQIAESKIGDTVTIKGEIWDIKNVYTRSGKVLTRATLNDGSGSIELVWFNQSWLTKSIKPGDTLQVSGKVNKFNYKTTISAPQWEKVIPEVNNSTLHTGRLAPVYPETYGLTSKWVRTKIANILPKVLPKIEDPLPDGIRAGLMGLRESLEKIHFPENYLDIEEAKKRLSFDELFYIQLATQKARSTWNQKKIIKPFSVNKDSFGSFISSLPFQLTQAQKKVVAEMVSDLQKPYPMNRLLQGDVGSGKTVVAAIAIYITHQNGLKSLLMTPTEILAFQHFDTLTRLLSPHGIGVGIYTGSKKQVDSEKESVIIGTHALLSDKLNTDDAGLVVVDEQQRFGVEQRGYLRNKVSVPHFLTMTATPIPRTVALTLYGDLDLSVIDELPKGRKPIHTHFIPENKRADSYQFMAKMVRQGEQIYIITPLIEESETQLSAKAAKTEYLRLQKDIFPDFRLGLLHGKMKSKDKEVVISDFRDKKIDILVSTSVVEVGMDIPNATIMAVEGAERFGLAQLHQLRGRVGRGENQSYAFLFAQEENPENISRLRNLETISDGLKLAELDLKIRGSGEIFGVRQSGRWNLKIASLSDIGLIEKTKSAASKILSEDLSLDKYPKLRRKLASIEAVQAMPD